MVTFTVCVSNINLELLQFTLGLGLKQHEQQLELEIQLMLFIYCASFSFPGTRPFYEPTAVSVVWKHLGRPRREVSCHTLKKAAFRRQAENKTD